MSCCEQCSTEFVGCHKRQRFCNLVCFGKYRTSSGMSLRGSTENCEWCGSEFYALKCQSFRKFCSVVCSNNQKKSLSIPGFTGPAAIRKRGRVRRRSSSREYVLDYLKSHPCIDCGEKDPVVLDFDHVRGVKVSEVSRLCRAGKMNSMKREIEKCDVRCRNCHIRRHAKERGFYRYAKD